MLFVLTEKKHITKKEKLAEAEKYYEKGEECGQKGDADGAIKNWRNTIKLVTIHFLCLVQS